MPEDVNEEERKREKIEEIAEEEMLKMKRENKMQTIQEIIDDITKYE